MRTLLYYAASLFLESSQHYAIANLCHTHIVVLCNAEQINKEIYFMGAVQLLPVYLSCSHNMHVMCSNRDTLPLHSHRAMRPGVQHTCDVAGWLHHDRSVCSSGQLDSVRSCMIGMLRLGGQDRRWIEGKCHWSCHWRTDFGQRLVNVIDESAGAGMMAIMSAHTQKCVPHAPAARFAVDCCCCAVDCCCCCCCSCSCS